MEFIILETTREATLADELELVAQLVGADLPAPWPGRALIEQAFSASLEEIRRAPETRLWGDRLAITRDASPRVVGSVIFHGRPDDNGIVEVGYGVGLRDQGAGYATEATQAQVEWALRQPGVRAVHATTPPWHTASKRVLEKIGFQLRGTLDHDSLGEVLLFVREGT
jgi:[ribosomal protein S5]-alanine N-acetyltransferase